MSKYKNSKKWSKKIFKLIDFDLLGAPFDWVMSIEVGEHIPAEYILTFVGNVYIIIARAIH